MSITKPFTFVAGTKARANEVNQNFDVLYSQVNSNISAINTNATDIDNLENNKANIIGDYNQRFAVANPTANTDAVNKQYLMSAIGNSIDYVNGLTIAKDTGSPDDTIIVSAGSCYDKTHSVVLKLSGATSKKNTNQGASTTYYVYIIGNATGSTINILISSSSSNPTLPSGYTLYRQIGNYTTNSSSKINFVSYYGNKQQGSNNPSTIVETFVSGTTWYRISGDGWCEQGGRASYNSTIGSSEETSPVEVTFGKSFINTNYTFLATSDRDEILISGKNRTSSKIGVVFKNTWVNTSSTGSHYAYWYACGYIK